MIYDIDYPLGMDTIFNGSAGGCDSVIAVDLLFFDTTMATIRPQICEGENFTINGSVYDENNRTGTEILTGANVFGCDSVVQVSLDVLTAGRYDFQPTVCESEQVSVNGTIYDIIQPQGIEVLPGMSANGCDSIIQVDLSFHPPAQSNFTPILCPGENVVINGMVYDENNRSGIETLAGASQYGCDSTLNVNLGFHNPAVGNIQPQICTGSSITINGTVYDQNNTSGIELFSGASQYGCDSTLNVSITFTNAVQFTLNPTLCPGESVVVNGIVYDQSNSNGSETFQGGSVGGCDSIVNVSLQFFQPPVGLFDDIICREDQVIVNGSVYDLTTPAGMEVFPAGGANGCDSTLIIDLRFYDDPVGNINDILCSDEQLIINGQIYDVNNPNGVEFFPASSYRGCDSTLNVSLAFSALDASFETDDAGCGDTNPGSITLTSISGIGPFVLSINAQNPQVIQGSDLPLSIVNLQAGNYHIVLQDVVPCAYDYFFEIKQFQDIQMDLGLDLNIIQGQMPMLEPTFNFDPVSYVWSPAKGLSCADCPNPVAFPLETTTYTLTVVDDEGCEISDQITINVQDASAVYAPNVFSPNNDLLNDYFTIYGSSVVDYIDYLRVFDRWGTLIFENTQFAPNVPNLGWDGTYKGEELNSAVFVFTASVRMGDGSFEMIKGDITLMRKKKIK